jgi:hypothetical protein
LATVVESLDLAGGWLRIRFRLHFERKYLISNEQ